MTELARAGVKPEKTGSFKRALTGFARFFGRERGNLKYMLKKHAKGSPMSETLVRLYNRADVADKEWLLRKLTNALRAHLLTKPDYEKAVDAVKTVTGICTGEKSTYKNDSKLPDLEPRFKDIEKLINWVLARVPEYQARFGKELIVESCKAVIALNPENETRISTLIRTWSFNKEIKSIALEIAVDAHVYPEVRAFYSKGEITLSRLLSTPNGREFLTSEIQAGRTEFLERLFEEPAANLNLLLETWSKDQRTVNYALELAAKSKTLDVSEKMAVFRATAERGFEHLKPYIQDPATQLLAVRAVVGLPNCDQFLDQCIADSSDPSLLGQSRALAERELENRTGRSHEAESGIPIFLGIVIEPSEPTGREADLFNRIVNGASEGTLSKERMRELLETLIRERAKSRESGD